MLILLLLQNLPLLGYHIWKDFMVNKIPELLLQEHDAANRGWSWSIVGCIGNDGNWQNEEGLSLKGFCFSIPKRLD